MRIQFDCRLLSQYEYEGPMSRSSIYKAHWANTLINLTHYLTILDS